MSLLANPEDNIVLVFLYIILYFPFMTQHLEKYTTIRAKALLNQSHTVTSNVPTDTLFFSIRLGFVMEIGM